MHDHRSGSSPPGRRAILELPVLALTAAMLVGACNGTTPRPSPTEAPATTDAVGPSAISSDTTSAEPPVGQTDTDWGRIRDELPEAFPVYPGATRADEVATEAVSGTFALEGADARAVVAWMQTELERGDYRTEALNGPFEDGSFVLDLVGDGDCRIQVAVGPLGGLTTVTVRYGAACPGS